MICNHYNSATIAITATSVQHHQHMLITCHQHNYCCGIGFGAWFGGSFGILWLVGMTKCDGMWKWEFFGLLVRQFIGLFVYWSVGPLICWSAGLLVHLLVGQVVRCVPFPPPLQPLPFQSSITNTTATIAKFDARVCAVLFARGILKLVLVCD